MIMAKVLVGRFTRGEKSMVKPPLLQDSDGHRTFDTTVDNVTNPKTFVRVHNVHRTIYHIGVYPRPHEQPALSWQGCTLRFVSSLLSDTLFMPLLFINYKIMASSFFERSDTFVLYSYWHINCHSNATVYFHANMGRRVCTFRQALPHNLPRFSTMRCKIISKPLFR